MPDDATIPVLTERLTLPSLDLDISLPQPPPPVVSPSAASVTPAFFATAPLASAETSWSASSPASSSGLPLHEAAPFSAPPPVFAPSLPVQAAPAPIDWDKIEAQLRDSLFRELQPQLSAELERQVQQRLQPTLVRALTALVSELRPALDSTVRETIARAISAEIARQRNLPE